MKCGACNRECRCPYRNTRDTVCVSFTRADLSRLLDEWGDTTPEGERLARRLVTALGLLPEPP